MNYNKYGEIDINRQAQRPPKRRSALKKLHRVRDATFFDLLALGDLSH